MISEDAFSSEIDNFYNAGCNDAGSGQPPMVGDMDYEEKVAYMKGYNARKKMKLNLNEARTIGPIKINLLKRLVQTNPNMDNEKLISELPSEWFDIWEGAYTEIQRVINDEKTKIMYGESYQKENTNSKVIDAFLANTFSTINQRKVWGTEHLKIKYSYSGNNGWGVMNYLTWLLFRSDTTGRLYFNIQKYSRTTTKIQSYINMRIPPDTIKVRGDEMISITNGNENVGDREEEESYKRNESKENKMKYTLVEEKRPVNEMISPTNVSSNLDQRDTLDRISTSDIRLPENPTDEDRFMVQAQKTFKQRYGRKPDMKVKEEKDEVMRYFSRLTPNYRQDTQEKDGLQTFDDEKKVYKLVDSQTKTEKESTTKPQYRLKTEHIMDDDDPMKEPIEHEDGMSDCCGAQIKWGDICCECGEHCEAVFDDDVIEDTIENIDSHKEEPETAFFGNEADDYETDEFNPDHGFGELDRSEYRGNDYGLDESTEPKEFILVEEVNTNPEAEVIEPTKSYTITKLEDVHTLTEANLFNYLMQIINDPKLWKALGEWFTNSKNTKDVNTGIHEIMNGAKGIKNDYLTPALKALKTSVSDDEITQISDTLEALLIKDFTKDYAKPESKQSFIVALKDAIKKIGDTKSAEARQPAKPVAKPAEKAEITVEK